MKRMPVASVLAALTLLAAACAATPTGIEVEPAPYRASVSFSWPALGADAASREEADADANADDADWRRSIEEAILLGLEELQVFSDVIPTLEQEADALARSEGADLVVVVRVDALGVWEEGDPTSVVPLLLPVDLLLWVSTGIGSWWIADREFTPRSDVQVTWRRPQASGTPEANGREPLAQRESLRTGDYRLSLWSRAKPWRSLMPYLANIVIPAAFVPAWDPRELHRSLATEALRDIKRELALTFKSRHFRVRGAPFRFRLEEPTNGSTVRADRVTLRFSYQLEAGLDARVEALLYALYVDVQREDDARFKEHARFTDARIRAINERIARGETIDVDIEGLLPGRNLVRFRAQTELGREWVTHTVVLVRR